MASLCYTWVWHPPYRSMCCRFHETLFGYTNYLTQAHDGIFKLVSMLAQQQLPWEYKNIWKFTICVQNWAWRIAHNLWYYFFFFFLPWRFWCMDQQRRPSIWSNTAWNMFVPMFMLPKLEKQLTSPQIYVLTRYASKQTWCFCKLLIFLLKWRFTFSPCMQNRSNSLRSWWAMCYLRR